MKLNLNTVSINRKLGNYEPVDLENRTGTDVNDKSYRCDINEIQEIEYGLNRACSDKISLNRSVLDTRVPQCRRVNYSAMLPTASVIIVFYNECWSVLLRTLYSVINRSPAHMLLEVLLIDDFSDEPHLGEQLDIYITQHFYNVRLVRNKKHLGIVLTRSHAAQLAKGQIIIFMDGHCEVNLNWLPPLLAPIMSDYQTMTVPIIDIIDQHYFEYKPMYRDANNYHQGIFDWGLLYKETHLPNTERLLLQSNPTEPYKSPTHSGAIFAIDRKYFLEIGAYDPGLLNVGGENLYLSFKVWQCGGNILWVPCSRVGHVFKFNLVENTHLTALNYKRIVETWFDRNYKKYFYTRVPFAQNLHVGNISEQLALKERLKCKSFDWFMNQVAYDVLYKYPAPPPNLRWGQLLSVATNFCVDTVGFTPPAVIIMSQCLYFDENQLIRLNIEGQMGVGEWCIDAQSPTIKTIPCHFGKVNGPWIYNEIHLTLYHKIKKKCIVFQNRLLLLQPCDNLNIYQKWKFIPIFPNI